ncbi:MAG: hypothetical protein EXQ87_06265 [Alphaproteobacteria bacterium]|nr:hypothetical protein [Alphaproteobacteria bacterium]
MRPYRLFLWFAINFAVAGSASAAEVRFSPVGMAATPGVVAPDSIPAPLNLPALPAGRVPAIVIVHASAGLMATGPERDYAAALNAAGIATLVIDMWTPRGMPSGPAAFGGAGGAVRVTPNAELTRRARAETVAFFQRAFAR